MDLCACELTCMLVLDLGRVAEMTTIFKHLRILTYKIYSELNMVTYSEPCVLVNRLGHLICFPLTTQLIFQDQLSLYFMGKYGKGPYSLFHFFGYPFGIFLSQFFTWKALRLWKWSYQSKCCRFNEIWSRLMKEPSLGLWQIWHLFLNWKIFIFSFWER